MARYKARAAPFHVLQHTHVYRREREDSGVHLDEPLSPLSPVTSPVSPLISPVSDVTSQGSPLTSPVSPVSSPVSHVTSQGSQVTSSVSLVTSPLSSRTSVISPLRKQMASNISPAQVLKYPEKDIASKQHGVTGVTVKMIPKDETASTGSAVLTKLSTSSPDSDRSINKDQAQQAEMSSPTKNMQCLSLGEHCVSQGIQDSNKVIPCNTNNRTDINVVQEGFTVSVTVSEDEGLDTGDNLSDLVREDFSNKSEEVLLEAGYSSKKLLETEESSDGGSSDNVSSVLNSKTDSAGSGNVKYSKRKETQSNLDSLFPGLTRSQSVGCDTKLVEDDATHLAHYSEKLCEPSDASRRVIHKTCSADAAMMASDVLPIDPQELMRNKQKYSLARNMRKKLQKLKRRNTDSLLGAAIVSMRGTTKITQADASRWAASFDALLSDKNGLEMFRNFLKSEFSEENIDFWIACEEFKTVRTSKLVLRAQKIYSDFIAINAPKQVNLDSKTRLETVTNLENPTRDMFRTAQKRIQFLMENDSYKRFLDSDAYRHLIRRYSTSDDR